MSEQIQSNVAERVLSGEKTFESIQFPITGDSELDFCAAVIQLQSYFALSSCMSLRALEYLRARFSSKELEERQQHQYLVNEIMKLREQEQQRLKQYVPNNYPGNWSGTVCGQLDPAFDAKGLGSMVTVQHNPKTLMQVFSEEEEKAKRLKNP